MNRDINDFIAEFSAEEQTEINAKADIMAEEMLAFINAETLKPIRKAFKNTQEDVSKKLGIGQVAISKLEGRTDIYVSTLRRYLGAFGASLQLNVKLKDGGIIPLESFGFAENKGRVVSAASKATVKNKVISNSFDVASKNSAKRRISESQPSTAKKTVRKKIAV